MAKGLFKNFPTTVYDNDGSGSYKQVTDIFRRVSLRSDLKSYIQTYDLQNIDGTQKPERLANLAHGDPNRNWIVMMMNDVENPYSDWFMSEEEFYNYMKKKYPNKVLILKDVYNSNNIYQSFSPEETLNIGNAIIVRFNPTLKTIVYRGDDIGANVDVVGSVGSHVTSDEASKDEIYGPHHIDSDGKVITNWEYEEELNEAKSQVVLLDNSYLDRIEDEFKKKIK